jgi:hypothetical protein
MREMMPFLVNSQVGMEIGLHAPNVELMSWRTGSGRAGTHCFTAVRRVNVTAAPETKAAGSGKLIPGELRGREAPGVRRKDSPRGSRASCPADGIRLTPSLKAGS